MATQYDKIGTRYNDVKSLPAIRLERPNFEQAVQPWVRGSRVLDLACGTGYYSRSLLAWGATEVVGVDISEAMIDGAKAASKGDAKIQYLVGDCSKPVKYEGAPFDLVTGTWFLNYATGQDDLVNMFRTIAMNLRAGGHFVGITPAPVDDPKAETKDREESPNEEYGLTVRFLREVEGGVKKFITMHTSPRKVEFETYHLCKGLYEKSAREAGLTGKLLWKEVEARDEWREQLGDVGPGFWDQCLAKPHFGILVVNKD